MSKDRELAQLQQQLGEKVSHEFLILYALTMNTIVVTLYVLVATPFLGCMGCMVESTLIKGLQQTC